MRVLGRHRLDAFNTTHAEAKGPLLAWLAEAVAAQWNSPHDIKLRYPSASFVGNGQVIFNIKGNKYRLKVTVAYQSGSMVIDRIGTHAEYNKWD